MKVFHFLFLTCLPLLLVGQNAQLEVFSGLSFAIIREKIEPAPNITSNIFKSHSRMPFGLICDIGMSEHTMLETGIIFSQRGSKIFGTKLNLNYVDLPINLVIRPKNFRFFIGPQISLLRSAKSNDLDLDDAFEKSDFGIRYGVGTDVHFLSFRVIVQNGITDTFKHPNYKWRSNSISLTVGYLFTRWDRSKFAPSAPIKRPVI